MHMGRSGMFHHDTDPKHEAQSTCQWNSRTQCRFWSVHVSLLTSGSWIHFGEESNMQFRKKSPNLKELKGFDQEEWEKRKGLIHNDHKRLTSVTDVKGAGPIQRMKN